MHLHVLLNALVTFPTNSPQPLVFDPTNLLEKSETILAEDILLSGFFSIYQGQLQLLMKPKTKAEFFTVFSKQQCPNIREMVFNLH